MTATATPVKPIVLLDTDPDTLGAARLIIDALRSEIESLRTDLRATQQQLGQFEEVSEQPHIETNWADRTYTVERTFILRYGPFHEFHEAVKTRAAIMVQTQVVPLADITPKKGE